MANPWIKCLTIVSIICGLLSAASWFRGSVVKVSHEKAMELRIRQAEKRGEKPNLSSMNFDGWDMSATFSAQSKWNTRGAFLAACSILMQSVAQAMA